MPLVKLAMSSDNRSSTPIHSLPDELLRDIFEYAAALYAERVDVNFGLLPALLATCTIWRANAFATPRLWTLVYFAYKMTRDAQGQDALFCNLDSVPTYLRCSQQLRFELCVEIFLHPLRKAYAEPRAADPLQSVLGTLTQQLVTHAHRCVAIDIVEEGQRYQPMFMPPRGMFNLRRLRLDFGCPRESSDIFPARFKEQIPLEEQSIKPLFVKPEYDLDTLVVDMPYHHFEETKGLSFATLKYASELAGLRCLKVSILHISPTPVSEILTLKFNHLEVLALIGQDHILRQKCRIVAPNLLYIAYTPVGFHPSATSWYFPKLREFQANPDSCASTIYRDFITNHLPSLRTVMAHPITIPLLLRTVDPSAAPDLRVLRIARRDQNPAVGGMVPFGVVDAVLQVLEARQEVHVEANPRSILSMEMLLRIAPDAIKTRLQEVAERWRDVREVSIVDRFFQHRFLEEEGNGR